ncbi:MAG: ATP-binding protein [Candidatus Margulisbacteria bacterium]|nr:ATP-binding protein [Candidatus Margulisiibacteriota bacterium]
MKDQHLHIQIACDLKLIKDIRKILKDFCKNISFNDEDLVNVELALNEGISNAIAHGSSNNKKMHIDIDFMVKNKDFIIIIKDYGGKEFNPEYYERITLKKDWGRGGRGIYLIKTIMDDVSYIFSSGHYTVLYMSKKIK